MSEIITIQDQNAISITGATKVVSSSPNGAIVNTKTSTINISGSEIEVKKLDLDKGEVAFSGMFTNVKFSQPKEKTSLLKRIFKWFMRRCPSLLFF